MKTIRFYLLKELAIPLVLWLVFLFVLLFLMQFLRGADVLLGSAVTTIDIARLAIFLSPHFIAMSIPIALLLAILLGLGRLGEDREMTALQALGVGPWQILTVPLLLGTLLGAITLAMASSIEPWGLRALNNVITQVIKRNLVGDVKSGVFYEDLSQLTLYAEHVNPVTGKWKNVLLHDDRDPEAPLLVLAQTGEVNALGTASDDVEIEMHDGHVHLAKKASTEYTFLTFEHGEIDIGVYDSIWRKNTFRSSKEEQTPRELYLEAKQLRAQGGEWLPAYLSYHLRLAQTFAPIAFAFLGTSLALGRRFTRRGGGYFLTILGYVAYYVLVKTFESLATQGKLNIPLAAELPNAIFAVAGIALLHRLTRTRAMP